MNQYYVAHKYSKTRWCPKLVRRNGNNVVHGYNTYTSKARCEAWCDAMNMASMRAMLTDDQRWWDETETGSGGYRLVDVDEHGVATFTNAAGTCNYWVNPNGTYTTDARPQVGHINPR